ncbi:hypothetical protein ACSVDA_02870 [Cytobacillus sp. Hm23]
MDVYKTKMSVFKGSFIDMIFIVFREEKMPLALNIFLCSSYYAKQQSMRKQPYQS